MQSWKHSLAGAPLERDTLTYSSLTVIDKVRSLFHIVEYKIEGILAGSSNQSLVLCFTAKYSPVQLCLFA